MTRTTLMLIAIALPWCALADEPAPTEPAAESATATPTPGPSIWAKQTIGVALFPKGAISDTKVEYRVPGHRSDSAVFQNTYYGVGGRVQLSPAFIDVGPRITLAPIDVFSMDIQGSWTGYAGPFGPMPFEGLEGRIESARDIRKDNDKNATMAMHKVELTVSPTVKLKVGPVIAFSATNIGLLKAFAPEGEDAPFFYEPYRDMVLAYDDVTIENHSAAVVEIMDGDGKSKLWVGGTVRYRHALVSKDQYTTAGGLVVFKPGTAKAMPTFIGQVLFYVKDLEREGTTPNINIAATWTFDRKLGLKAAVAN